MKSSTECNCVCHKTINVTRVEIVDRRLNGAGRLFVARPARVAFCLKKEEKELKIYLTDPR